VPIRWRLDRPPVREAQPLSDEALRDVASRYDLERATTTKICLWTSYVASARRRLDDGLDLGPQGQVVMCVAAQLEAMNVNFLNSLLSTMMCAHFSGWGDGFDRGLINAYARVNARQAAVDDARALADRTVLELLGTADRPRRLLRDAAASVGFRSRPSELDVVIDMVRRYARTTLAAEAAADVLPRHLYLSATTVRDVVLADREIRLLPNERIDIDAATRFALRASIGSLTAEQLRPYVDGIARMSQETRDEWSLAVLRAEFDAAHALRALPPLSELFGSSNLARRLRRQHAQLSRDLIAGRDIQKRRQQHIALRHAATAFAAWATLPADADEQLRRLLAGPIPPSLSVMYDRVERKARELLAPMRPTG